MSQYIVCQKKRNNPRMDVRICEKKCPIKDDCEAYLTCNKILVQNKNAAIPTESQTVELSAA